jgi:hypothetical protein
MSKKKVEYRDTFDFRLFPEYTYTKVQHKRLRLFQGRIEHWRAAINYADSFEGHNKINILFMLGYDAKMEAYINRTKNNVVILCAKIPKEFLQAYDAYWTLIEKLRNVGYADKDGNLTPIFYTERKKEAKYRGTGALSDELYQAHDLEDHIINEYEHVKAEIGNYFANYIVIDKGHSGRRISHENLDWIIKQYFPFGREQCGISNQAVTSIKRIADALQAGLDRENTPQLLGFPTEADCYTICKQSIRRCQMDLNIGLRNKGSVDLVKLVNRMRNPPYGWDFEPHAAYCLGYALSEHLDESWIWDGIACFSSREIAVSVLRNILAEHLMRRHSFQLITETGWRLSNRFAYMFDLNADNHSPKDATDEKILELHQLGLSERKIAAELGTMTNIAIHKRLVKMRTASGERIPFCNMAFKICKKVESLTRWPIAIIDEHLWDALYGAYDEDNHTNIPIFGRDRVRDALSYFTLEKCKELKARLETINDFVPSLIRNRYGADVNIEEIERACTTQSSGWLWESDVFWECVDRYMNRQ